MISSVPSQRWGEPEPRRPRSPRASRGSTRPLWPAGEVGWAASKARCGEQHRLSSVRRVNAAFAADSLGSPRDNFRVIFAEYLRVTLLDHVIEQLRAFTVVVCPQLLYQVNAAGKGVRMLFPEYLLKRIIGRLKELQGGRVFAAIVQVIGMGVGGRQSVRVRGAQRAAETA